jgi:hypothetical protein
MFPDDESFLHCLNKTYWIMLHYPLVHTGNIPAKSLFMPLTLLFINKDNLNDGDIPCA